MAKKKTTPVAQDVKETEVKKQEVQETPVTPEPEKKEEKKKPAFTLRTLATLEEKAEKLALAGKLKEIPDLTDEPGVLLKAFKDTLGVLRLRVRYEKDGEILRNKVKTLHKF